MKLSSAYNTLVAVLLGVLLAACGSTPPSEHYILRATAQPPGGDSGIALGVGPVSVPEYLRRENFVFNGEANRLEITSRQRWAEPLQEGIARVMTLNLAGLLQTQDVRPYPWHPRRKPQYAVQLRVMEMDADASRARLIAEWLLLDPETDAPLQRRIAQLQQSLTSREASAVAAAYSDLLYQLSEQIAAAIEAETAPD